MYICIPPDRQWDRGRDSRWRAYDANSRRLSDGTAPHKFNFNFIVPPPSQPPDIHRQSFILRVHLLSAGRMCKVSGASRRT